MLKRKAEEHEDQEYQRVCDPDKNKRLRNDGGFSSLTLSEDEMSNDLSASDKNPEEIHGLDESVFDLSELSPAQVQPSLPCQGMLAKKGLSKSPTFDGDGPENQLCFFLPANTVPTSVKPSSEEGIDEIPEDFASNFETSLSF